MRQVSIRIREDSCIGCGRCADICPGNLIHLNADGKACIPHVRDCWGCTSCIKECPVSAIDFFLGPDLEGRGTTLTVKRTQEGYRWIFKDRGGRTKEIGVNAKSSNRY